MSPDLWLVREEWRQFARFLAERGGGVHHVAVVTPDFRRTLQEQRARGNEPILSDTFSGVEVAFLSTERELGVILEVFSGIPKNEATLSASLHRK
jgi:methylmalonyl-CoA/ethylmalonyl-CoA epimerase